MQDLTHYINGSHVHGTSGRFSDVFNPATGEVQARCPLASRMKWPRPSPWHRPRSPHGARPTRSAARG